MFTSLGTLVYSTDPVKVIVKLDDELADFYRSLIPKNIKLNKPMYKPHISVVRNVTPPDMSNWGLFDGDMIVFSYDSYIHNDELYYWLDVKSETLEFVRSMLGLKPWGDVSLSPDGRHKFHITLGNLKNKNS